MIGIVMLVGIVKKKRHHDGWTFCARSVARVGLSARSTPFAKAGPAAVPPDHG